MTAAAIEAKTRDCLGDAEGMDTASYAKRLANLRARCALQGVELYATTDDHERPLYVATRWAMTKALASLDEVAAWIGRIDGKTE